MANGSRHKISVIPEATWGVTPATPNFVTQRVTGVTLGMTKATLESAEIRADRQTADTKHGTRQIGDGISGELSFETWDVFFEALLGGTWTDDTLKAGLTRRSFSVLREYEDLSGGEPFMLYSGVEVDSLKMEVSAESIVTLDWGLLGKDQITSATEPTGATYTDANENKVIDAFSGALEEGGAPIAVVTAISLTIENGMDPKFVVGSQTTIHPGIGRFKISGELTAFFEDSSLLTKFIEEEETSIDLTLQDKAGNSYRFYLPRVVLLSGKPDVTSEAAIPLSMSFSAIRDAASASNIIIERTAA